MQGADKTINIPFLQILKVDFDTMNAVFQKDFLIIGTTLADKRFQPSDWAERLSGSLSSLRGRRIVYSPLLMPVVHDEVKSLRVASELKSQYPAIFEEVVLFATKNNLRVTPCHESACE